MSDTKDPNQNKVPLPPGEMRATLEASQDLKAADICERLEDFLDDLLRKLCSKKQFELISGNCNKECQTVEEPKIVPCLRLRWGDGPQDHLERVT